MELNKEKLSEKISVLEETLVNCVYEEFMIPLMNEAIEAEIAELNEKDDKEAIKERKMLLKTNKMRLKGVQGNRVNLEKAIPFLKSQA